jgi:predicted aspartyl protease
LSLPLAVVTALALPALAPRIVTLADASQKVLSYYSAEVLWDGQPLRIRVLCVESTPLLGTALLRRHKLEVDFTDGGPVAVSALP